MSGEKTRIEQIIEEINAKNAKRIALVLVIGFVCFHGVLHLRYGTNSCRWLLSAGRYKGDQEWQPYGCMLHLYTKIDTRRCLRYIAFYGTETHFVFIGDSKIRDLYKAFIDHLIQDETVTTVKPQKSITDLHHIDNRLKIKVEFIWSPFISRRMIEKFREWEFSDHPPSVIIVGSAIWAIRTSNASLIMLQEYKINLTRLIQPINGLHMKKCKVLWAIQEPVYQRKLNHENQMITNKQIDIYNKAAIEILSYSAVELWWSVRLVGQGMLTESPDGIHLAPKPLKHNAQILYNMYCNDYMNFNDGTCCSSAEPYTTIQIVTFSILAICIVIFILLLLQKLVLKLKGRPIHEYVRIPENEQVQQQQQQPQPQSQSQSQPQPQSQPQSQQQQQQQPQPQQDQQQPLKPASYYELFTSLSKLSLIMLFFFVCDRTNFFMKENKYYSEFSFWIPIVYVFILGLFFTEDSKFTKILHRDQLNEWKGWMLIVILVYHVTGASQILPINMHIKVLISSFLFLLGYEQFCVVWQRNDINIVNFFRSLFELNFITVTLCLCMNRPYQFYYFVPLLSFWYLMIYSFLAFPPHITAQTSENNVIQYFYLLIKFIVLFSVITILFMSEVFFEKVFVTRPWKALFVTTDDDIHEWWFRWKLDRYSVLYGMTFALILLLSRRYNIFDDNNHNNLFSRGIPTLSATLISIIGICCYVTLTFLCRNELECSEIHSYIVFIPIVSYIVLRNISGVLRTRYSSLFAWFGEISLELFISQYHIWLAADTHGVLVLIPGYPVLNIIITSFIFVCASHEIHKLTKFLLPYAVPLDWKSVLRNFILFLAILVPIGINDGMF